MELRSHHAIKAGALAVLSNNRILTVGDQARSAVTAEVAWRQPEDGSLYVIDRPFASLESEEITALVGAVEG